MNESTNAIIENTDQVAIEDLDEAIGAIEDQGDEVETTLTLEQIVDLILEASGKSEFTLYGLSTVLNNVLEAIGATKEGKDYRVRSQMMYQYNTNKLIAKNDQGKGIKLDGVVNLTQARAFIIRFSGKFAK